MLVCVSVLSERSFIIIVVSITPLNLFLESITCLWTMRSQQRDQDSRAFYDLSALVLSLLRSPPTPISLPDHHHHFPDSPMMMRSPQHRSLSMAHITPSGFASLLLGISVALMLCGSVTFFIGFLLLPWVLALIVVLYVAGIVSIISMAGRSILSYLLTPPPPFSSRKEISGNILLMTILGF